MELHLEVVLLSTIKRKKPWPRFCWLGLEKESVFLLDDNRISEINMVSGRTKRKVPKLQPLVQRALTTAVSRNGMWLAGLLVSGDVFLWSKDRGCLKTINAAPSVSELVTAAHEGSVRLSLLVSGDGRRVLLTALTGQVFLWECSDRQDLAGARDGVVRGHWRHVLPPETAALPSPQDKEASQNSVFAQGEAVGDCCLTAFVFTAGAQLTVTFLRIQWEESSKLSSAGCSVHWVTQTYPLPQLSPPCRPVKSRGALVPAFSPDGQLLAVALNQRDPRATQVLFISTLNFVTVSSWLGGCGSKNLSIPSKYVRSYWVACMSWAPGGLLLACVLKRGSLLLLARLGGLLSLSTSGCSVELGPAHFLPLHPLVTCRLPGPALPGDASPTSSCASARDALRQRYSAAWHPRQPYLLMSDGYTASVLRAPPPQASPAALVRSLLLHCAEGLERARGGLGHGKPQVRRELESMPTLKLTAGLQELGTQEAASSTLPHFLRDETDTTGITQTYTGSQFAGEEDSDDEGTQFLGMHAGDRGRLEFASMFDTLHAHSDSRLDDLHDPEETGDEEGGSPPVLDELERAQRSLLTAWALAVSMGDVLEDGGRLLRSVVRCAVRLAGLLRVALPKGEKPPAPGLSCAWPLFRNLYALLPWDGLRGGGCLGAAVELTGRVVRLILSPLSDDAPKRGRPGLVPQTLSSALLFLRMASRSLDLAYSLPQGAPPLASDVFSVPFLKEGNESGVSQNALLAGQRPSSRLLEVWRGLYGRTLQYQAASLSQTGPARCAAEQEQLASILHQIQRALQEHGDQLGDGPALHRATGEQLFLCGSYEESAEVWRAELCAEKERGGAMLCVLETRFCLALLYGHLFQYQLHRALGLCEHLAQQLTPQSRLEEESGAESAGVGRGWEAWLLVPVGREAACAAVQSFGRFMAAYFTNQPLSVLPPHSVGVLPPLHLPAGTAPGQRLVPLSRSRVLGEVWRQQLSEMWTVDYALELLLQGGLLPEAAWLAHRLGDWKTAASLSLAYCTYCSEQADFSRLNWRELHLPAQLQPGCIFREQLELLLGLEAGGEPDQSGTDSRSYEQFADAVMEEDVELQVSVQEVLRASVMARVDVLSRPLHRLTDAAKDLASRLSGLVPPGVYLPAPPLYCPQPASDTQASVGDVGVASEGRSRQCISGVLQRALLLLRSANCSLPAAQWYITNLQQRQQLLHKKLSQPLNPFPEGLKEFVTSGAFFSPGTNGEACLDSVTVQVIACFREVCGLCWMLHVRDQLSVSCRKYQAARTQVALCQGGESAGGGGSDVVERCTDALHWACRLLPFARFLKAEELLQDLVLSLVSELPPVTMVADILAQVFPEEEESVQVSLREKYSALLQRLRHCTLPVSELDGAELQREAMLTVLIQQQLVHRRRVQRKIARHLAPLKRQIWERLEEEEEERTFDRFSPSHSTLSDSRCSPLSNGNRTATPTDSQERPAFSPQLQRGQPWSGGADGGRPVERGSGRSGGKEAISAPPPVGTWEFELLDEEYPRFLELFLSYVLERDCGEDKALALPLLSGFSPQLREAELHSLAFDVLTTLKRRQRGQWSAAGRRPGGAPAPAPQGPSRLPSPSPSLSVRSEALVRTSTPSGVQPPGPRAERPQGLFGLRQARQPMRVTQAEGAWPGPEAGRSSPAWTPQSDHKASPSLDLPEPEARFRDLSRLLEWMVRWADRRVRVGHPAPRRTGAGGAAEGVVMRAKASTPAVLTALRVLESRYTAALLAAGGHCPSFRGPEAEFTPALAEPEVERTVHTGCSESPVSLPPLESLHGEDSEASEVEEVEPETDVDRAVYQFRQEGALRADPESRPREASGGSQDEPYDFAAESESESRREESFSPAGSASCISVQIKTLPRRPNHSHEQALTLADLDSDREETEGDVSHGTSVELRDPDPALEPNVQPTPVPGPHPGPRVQSLPSSSTPQLGMSPDAPPPAVPPEPFRQLVQEQIFRLVQFQQMSFISILQTVAASFPNLPPMNQSQYPNPTDNLPPLNQSQYPNPTPNLAPSNSAQYPIPTDNLFYLNQTRYPNPTDNYLPPLNQSQYPNPTGNLAPLNQNQYPFPTDNMAHQPRAPFFQPRQQGPHQPDPQSQGPVTVLQASAEKPNEQQHSIHPDQSQGTVTIPQWSAEDPDEPEDVLSLSLSSETQCQSDVDSISEEVREFPVRPEDLRVSQAERENLILGSFRNGCVTPVPHQGVPLLRAAGSSQGSSSAVPPAPRGIKLLQLHPPARSSLPPPPVPTGLLYSAAAPPRPREAFVRPHTDAPVTRREAGPAPRPFGTPQERVFLDPRVRTAPGHVTQPKAPDSPGKGVGQGAPLNLILAPQPHRQPPPHGLPLLRFHPEPRLPAAVAHAPVANSAKPLISVPGLPGPTWPAGPPWAPGPPGHSGLSSSIQLLQRDPDPPSKVLLGRGAAWTQEHRGGAAGVAAFRLLTGVSRDGPAHNTLASSKRQKRRDEREQEGEYRSTGRLEGFSVPATEPDKVEAPGSALEEDFVISNEPIGSLLGGRDLVSRALSTAAELHAFASTQKRPPELHDACTNTDSAPPAGEVQVETAAAVCPGVLLNLQFPREPEKPDRVEQVLDVHGAGRHFINVVNLEDEELLEHLPSRQSPTPPSRPTSPPAAPAANPALPDLPVADRMAVGMMVDAQLEPRESPSPPAAPAAWAAPEPPQEREPLGVPKEREPVGLRGSLGFSVSFSDAVEQSYSDRVTEGGMAEAFDATMDRSVKLADEPLELSDMADTLAELVGGRGAFTSLLGLSDTQMDRLIRLGEQKNVDADQEQERQELRAWMRKRQREMLAEYRRQREERREREHRPFAPSTTQTLTSRELSTNKKMKEMKEKTLLLEHHTQRAREACSLITELLAPSPALSTLTKPPQPQSTNQSIRWSKGHLPQSTNQSGRWSKGHLPQSTNQSGRRAVPRGLSRPEGRRGRSAPFPVSAAPRRSTSASGEQQPSDRHQHRPGALPDTRLSRWGMKDMQDRRMGKGWMKGMEPSLREGRRRGETDLREEVDEREEEVVSPWNPPPEIRRLLGLEEQGSVAEGNESAGSGAGLWLKSLDSLSDSTGSILSKLDWAAIEKMVAGEEEV
ncbi:ciliogenesis and planar polarity effector 1 isoform X2 [Anguilla rostrata]|uniref:ciliogenesis and planar polarity effector 1 isoform X2 n=1 Tax=Anguilla rostrata TaxID=7938 RepID=UPI0030D1C927